MEATANASAVVETAVEATANASAALAAVETTASDILFDDSLILGASAKLIPKVKAATADLAGGAGPSGQPPCTGPSDCDGIKQDAKLRFDSPFFSTGGASSGQYVNLWPYPISPRPGMFVTTAAAYYVEHYLLRKVASATGETLTLLDLTTALSMQKYPDAEAHATCRSV